MTSHSTPCTLVQAAPHWRSVDFVSDLHLQEDGDTWGSFAHYLQHTPADAVFLLGDIFELWAGDDVLDSPAHAFERMVADTLRLASQQRALYLMHGNRDFLLGPDFCHRAGLTLLQDPCVLAWQQPAQRILLSHGDALCIDDHAYMQFRQRMRDPAWQQAVLSRPLSERLALALQLRQQSSARKNELGVEGYADVDAATASAWLRTHHCHTLVHGHTHRPGDHVLDNTATPPLQRMVLTDWDYAAMPPRAGILRWTPAAPSPWQRVPVPRQG